jgi:hypothetical protein
VKKMLEVVMSGGFDKRGESRGELDITARYRVVDGNVTENKTDFFTAEIINISVNGAGMLTSQKHEAGDIIELELDLKGKSTNLKKPVHTLCKVQWSKTTPNGLYETGMDIIVIEEDDVKKLEKYVSDKNDFI